VLRRRFGLTGGEPQTLEAIGREIGLTRARIRQIETRHLHFEIRRGELSYNPLYVLRLPRRIAHMEETDEEEARTRGFTSMKASEYVLCKVLHRYVQALLITPRRTKTFPLEKDGIGIAQPLLNRDLGGPK